MSSLKLAFDEVYTLLTTLAYDMEERLMEPLCNGRKSCSFAIAGCELVRQLIPVSSFKRTILYLILVGRNGLFLELNYNRPKSV